MCGIAGIVHMEGKRIERAHERIERMTQMLIHRGPDSQETYLSSDGVCALGYTRLAIVDPGNRIPQPLSTPDGKAVLAFNGEIYNYLSVRDRLEKRGVHFRTHMDTEVLLEGFYRDGESFLEHCDGMWAFAYWDVQRRRLWLSRDVMGERHLFYRHDRERGEFIFASEPQPILADADGRVGEIDFESLVCSLRFSAAPPGRTLIVGIERLLPGHIMTVAVGEEPKMHRYRKLHPERWFDFFAGHPSLDAVIEQFETMFHAVCARRLPEHVPFISTLSGGIDSTLICAFASDGGRRRIATLYGESADIPRQQHADELDEYRASHYTSAKFNTEHHEVKMNGDESIPILQHIAQNGFDGSIDMAIAPFEMLARSVRAGGRKVILISDGPDELAGGYLVDQRAYAIDRLKATHPRKYHALRFLSMASVGTRALQKCGYGDLRISPWSSYDPFRFVPVHESISPEALRPLVPEEFIRATSQYYGTIDPVYHDLLPHLDYTQMRALSYASRSLPDHFNMRTDKAFLHASVECRLPYQSPEMVEFLIAMPASFRFGNDGTATKYLLRSIVERRVGPQIAHRSKYGFSLPLFRGQRVMEALRVEELLQTTNLFQDLPFRPRARHHVLTSEGQ